MNREEINSKVVGIEDAAKHLKKAWLEGDIKRYHRIEYDILAALKAAKEQIKDDLYREAIS